MKSRAERDKLLAQFRKTPVVQVACERTGVGRTTYYQWRKDDEAFARAADEAIQAGTELINDMAESMLIAGIRDGSHPSISFWLKHRHPKYGTKIEVDASHRLDETLTPEQESVVEAALKLSGKAVETSDGSD